MEPAERLKQWFANHYQRETFRLSMEEIRIDVAGFNTLLGFLAQGVALAAYGEDRYCIQLAATHKKLAAMIEDLQGIPGHEASSQYHYPLILGVLIEMSLGAVAQLKKEDRGD